MITQLVPFAIVFLFGTCVGWMMGHSSALAEASERIRQLMIRWTLIELQREIDKAEEVAAKL